MKNTFFQKFAFTLAEVLITLVIIGVVAAMTIPTLIAKYQDQVTVTKLKKAQTTLAQIFSIINAEEGLVIEQGGDGYYYLQTPYTLVFEHLKGAQVMNESECADYWGNSGYNCALTQDGIVYGIHYFSYVITGVAVCTNVSKNNCTHAYFFDLTENGNLIPDGAPNSNNEIRRNTTCPQAFTSYINPCTYWTLKTGKVKKKSGEWDESLGTPSS